jgi:rRNA maturation endonuclease Nob1
MPIFDLRCAWCRIVYEDVEVPFGEEKPHCPICGGPREVHWEMGKAPNFQLKGGGWAKDGYSK